MLQRRSRRPVSPRLSRRQRPAIPPPARSPALPPNVENRDIRMQSRGNCNGASAADRKTIAIPEKRRCSPSALVPIEGDRKSVVSGKRVSVRVELGGSRIIKKKKNERRREIKKQR